MVIIVGRARLTTCFSRHLSSMPPRLLVDSLPPAACQCYVLLIVMLPDLCVILLQKGQDASVVAVCDSVRFRVKLEGWQVGLSLN